MKFSPRFVYNSNVRIVPTSVDMVAIKRKFRRGKDVAEYVDGGRDRESKKEKYRGIQSGKSRADQRSRRA